MSDELFEVAFSGQIRDGADLNEVKARVGKMFNADAAKLDQLFSGKRIIIKKNIDSVTAKKYETALARAGAMCDLQPVGSDSAASSAAVAATAAASKSDGAYASTGSTEVAPPPQVDPLGITGDQIGDLSATIAPVGSELQDSYQQSEEPVIDISGIDIAPVGSELSTADKKDDPPPPDTSGISMDDG